MAIPVHYEQVKELAYTGGTGTLTLDGAVVGYRSFSVVGTGNTCYYKIVDGAQWEYGIGTYTSSGTTLARTTILQSSNANAAVDLTKGTAKEVSLVIPGVSSGGYIGKVSECALRSAPPAHLKCDGSAISRTTYAALFNAIVPSLGTFTVTIASPGVFTLTSHGFAENDTLYFTTTGALPTGLSANTLYYVIAAGLTANDFRVSASLGGAAINTTGSQSGVHTVFACPYGLGDGSTTFNLPNCSGRMPVGVGGSTIGKGLGEKAGSESHTHSIPAHYHALGTGADLNIVASGSHTHTIDHNHASVTSGSAAPATDSQGNHQHFVVNTDLDNNALSASEYLCRSFDAVNDFSYDLRCSTTAANRALTSSTGAHTHTVASHTHDVDLPNFTGTSGSNTHTHAVGDFAGRVGLVTGGVDGNAAMTSGGASQAYIAFNFMIQYI